MENRTETVNVDSESDVNGAKWTTEKMRLGSRTITISSAPKSPTVDERMDYHKVRPVESRQ